MSKIVSLRPQFDLANPESLQLDLHHPSPKAVLELDELFAAAIKTAKKSGQPLDKLPIKTGWNQITPNLGVELLMRNVRNRRLNAATVFYYASQMVRGEWKATGQPILIDSDGFMVDAQHRLYAGLISGVTFKSFVVTGIEPIENLFAYIDNARSRSVAAALETAGFNGVAPTIGKVIKIGEEVKAGVYNRNGPKSIPRMSPADALQLSSDYPNAQPAAKAAAREWLGAVEYLSGRRGSDNSTRYKDIVAYMGMRIMDLHSEDVADDFFEAIASDEERAKDDPIAALHKVIDRDKKSAKPIPRDHVLAYLIKAFNVWNLGGSAGTSFKYGDQDDFPAVDASSPQAEAAE